MLYRALKILTIFTLSSTLFSTALVWPEGKSALAQQNTSSSPALPQGNFFMMKRVKQAKVIDILSPLTLLISDGSIIQLSGIGIPSVDLLMSETSYSDIEGTEPSFNPLAVTTLDILKDLLKGQRVNIYQTRSPSKGLVNRMGYTLAHVERLGDEAWVQGTLISLGLTYTKTSAYDPDMAADMLALEQIARENKAGIWRDDTAEHASIMPILSPFNAKGGIGTFSIVEGTIHSVTLKQNRIYINFGADWRRDFTVSIPPSYKRNFTDVGLDPQQWGGKTIRVRGFIRHYNGPYMEITHPEAVEFINAAEE